MMIRPLLATLIALCIPAAAALAQSPGHDRAATLIGPMMQEIAPGKGGEVFTACIVAQATPEEIAAFAAAPGPTAEVGAAITAILNRPATVTCAQAAAGG